MMQKLQRFGGAMFTPVLLFAFSGIILSIAIMMQNSMIVGGIAADGTFWSNLWAVIENGAWTVFNQMELLFVIGLPLGLAKKANGRAALESLVVYMTFNNFVSKIIELMGTTFGVDFNQEVGGASGLKLIAGIKTLDTNLIGAILIAAIVVWIHNRFFETKLPDWLGIFQGSSLVVIIGFFIMLPVAFMTAWIWPVIQSGIVSLQGSLASSGTLGVGIYVFLERLLIPTGLHHFIYQPFIYGPAVLEGGITANWLQNLNEIASSTAPIKELFPAGGFALHNASKLFAPLGISAAFYATAKPEKRKKILALLIPTALTAVLAGITEPFEFTFLFLAPQLFFVHAVLAGALGATLYSLGVVGDIGSGLIAVVSQYIIPMSLNHVSTIILLIVVGLIFSLIYFVVFRFAILKFDIKTPGREVDEEVKMYSKKEYRDRQAANKEKKPATAKGGAYASSAAHYLEGLGGASNIVDVNNCATRLRITVNDETLVKSDAYFKEGGAHGLVRKGKAFQVIIGLDVPQVREAFENQLTIEGSDLAATVE
ncbi:alpha-glucoside-specific PTS transporter subunit IIBC [Carnobacterium antarcticum]|uniref:Alpha-glucoside-specific PTS transporter subunit IIBC n=1 Tax=Carnobacterium antarcticum TaxID=2126436 RepID=A0ABW4NQM1_9LACT|nr:alpha-glucoside-specific PTS transporter subunit IIBC [Carnobacterium sp. CP1]ALV22638.1 PTS system, maltose and glucose-specific IIC component [Carnobacterium sp. CP1]